MGWICAHNNLQRLQRMFLRLVGNKMVAFIATLHMQQKCIFQDTCLECVQYRVWFICPTGVAPMVLWSFSLIFPSINLHMTHSKHQINRSTKAILSDIIQFEAPVPFPCYHWWNFYFQHHDSSLIALLVCQSHCVLRWEWNHFLL